MLKPPATCPAAGATGCAGRWPFCGTRLHQVCRLLLILFAAVLAQFRAAQTSWAADVVPLLAQAQKAATTTTEPPAAEGGSWPILDWLIVVALIGGALYVICRSSRRS